MRFALPSVTTAIPSATVVVRTSAFIESLLSCHEFGWLEDRQTNRLLADFVAKQAWIDLSFQPFCDALSDCLQNQIRGLLRPRQHGDVAGVDFNRLRLDRLRHRSFEARLNRAVLIRDQVPARFRLPSRGRHVSPTAPPAGGSCA